MEKIKVVAALIETNDKILIARRKEGALKDKWEFPGGKVNKNETDEEAILREIYEELNISIRCDYHICDMVDKENNLELKLYHCTYLSGEVVLNSHTSCVFVSKKLLLSYDLAPNDIVLAQKYLSKCGKKCKL